MRSYPCFPFPDSTSATVPHETHVLDASRAQKSSDATSAIFLPLKSRIPVALSSEFPYQLENSVFRIGSPSGHPPRRQTHCGRVS